MATQSTLASGLLVAVCLALVSPAGSFAAPADALTENSTRTTVETPALEFVDKVQRGCYVERDSPSLAVTCSEGGYTSFEYELDLPRNAINPQVFVQEISEETGEASFTVEGHRNGARLLRVFVAASGDGWWEFDRLTLTYDVPTTYDERPCVTAGEWARMSPWKGGLGGSLAKYAAVFETKGVLRRMSKWMGNFRFQVRAYRRCDSRKTYSVTFHQYRTAPTWTAYWG